MNPDLVVAIGIPGPRGADGPPGSSDLLQITAGAVLSGHRVAAQDAAGRAIYADSGADTARAVIGITEHASSDGQPVTVRQFGAMVWPAGGLTPDAPLFLGADGNLTHTPPAAGWVRQIAVALATDRIQVGIGPAFRQE